MAPLTRKRILELSTLYDELYERASKVFVRNPCQITKKGCLHSTNFCCSGCEHLSPKGCTVKSLSCKTWVCSPKLLTEAENEELRKIAKIAMENHLYSVRASKEQVFRRLADIHAGYVIGFARDGMSCEKRTKWSKRIIGWLVKMKILPPTEVKA